MNLGLGQTRVERSTGRRSKARLGTHTSGVHAPACPSLSSPGPRGGRQRKGHRPYPPLSAAAPRARGRDEAASAGSRRRTRTRRQGGARAGTGPAGQRPGPREAPGRLQPVRGGRRELLPGGFMAHRSRAPVRVTRKSAGLGCGAAAGGAGHARWARMLRPRVGVRGWGLGDGGAPSSALSAFRRAARRGGPRRFANLEPPPAAAPSQWRARPHQ